MGGKGFLKARCKTEIVRENTDRFYYIKIKNFWDFPGGTVVKNPPANAGDTGSSPGPGSSHMPRSN